MGSAVGFMFGGLVDQTFDTAWFSITAATVAGLNGLLSGHRGVYAWRTPGGLAAFLLDSTWSIVGTALGVIANLVDTVLGAGYSAEFSERRNRHVFAGGLALRRGFANTLGNVVSNASLGRSDDLEQRRDLIERHEGLHVWQQRWFGPLFQATYVVWAVGGAAVATVFGLASPTRRRRKVGLRRLVDTAAYYDNPFEYWAYRNDDRWGACAAEPVLKWGSFRWRPENDG